MEVGSSLAPYAALLMSPRCLTGFVATLHGLTGQQKAICKSTPGHLLLYCYCVLSGLCITLSNKMDFSIIVTMRSVFANPATIVTGSAKNSSLLHKSCLVYCIRLRICTYVAKLKNYPYTVYVSILCSAFLKDIC